MAWGHNAEYNGIPIIGADMVIGRGTRPGRCRIRVPHASALVASSGTLVLEAYNGPATFQGCVPDLSTLKLEHRPNRKREFSLLVYDRRRQWRCRSVTGNYNVRFRDNTIKPSTRRTVGELYKLLLDAAGESTSSTPSLQTGCFPAAQWDETHVPDAMDALGAVLPNHICRMHDDTFEVMPTGYGDQLNVSDPMVTPDFPCFAERGPRVIKVRCAPTWFQCRIELEAVGLDTDGQIKPINDLSYTPTTGWSAQWPTLFSDVDQDKRHLALDTVFRWYRIVPKAVPGAKDEDENPVSVDDVMQYELDDYLVEMIDSDDLPPGEDNKFLQPAYVIGEYWPYSDHPYNTSNCIRWPGNFTIDKETRIVKFDRPVFKLQGSFYGTGCIDEANVYLCTGFYLRKNDTWEYVRKVFDIQRESGASECVHDHAELWETCVAEYQSDCTQPTDVTKNTSAIEDEANVYLEAWKAHHDARITIRDILYAGTFPLSLSGYIEQISYRVGQMKPPTTRASEHYEHWDIR